MLGAPPCHVNVVPLGKSLTFSILSSAFGTTPLSTVCSFGSGVYVSACPLTFTVTLTVSFEPSGYVTVTTPALSPGPVVVLGVVAHMYVVPAGKLVLFTLVATSGVAP